MLGSDWALLIFADDHRYDLQSQQIILLGFGATRSFTPQFGQAYKNLMAATMEGNHEAMAQAGLAIGYFDGHTQQRHSAAVLDLFGVALEPLCMDGAFDFGSTDMAQHLRDVGIALGMDPDFWHIPLSTACSCIANLAVCSCWRRG